MANRVWYLNASQRPSVTSLCDTCRHSMQTCSPQGDRTLCAALMPTPIDTPQPVTRCTHYADGRVASIEELTASAWMVNTDPNGELVIAPPNADEAPEEESTNVIGYTSTYAVGGSMSEPEFTDLDEDDE